MKLSLHELSTTSYANRRNAPNTHRPPNKQPILPKLSTNYDLIMQNKANFPDAQMNVNKVLTADYKNIANWKLCENKANTNPIKANLKPISPKTNPIQSQYKPKQSQFQRQNMEKSSSNDNSSRQGRRRRVNQLKIGGGFGNLITLEVLT